MKIARRGTAGIAQFQAQLEKRGGNFTSAEAESVRQANLALKQIDKAMAALKQNVAIGLAPIITTLADSFEAAGIGARKVQDAVQSTAKYATFTMLAMTGAFGAMGPMDQAAAFFERIEQRTAAIRNTKPPTPPPANQLEEVIEAADKLTTSLSAQVGAYGRNNHMVEINRLAQRGATEEMLASARARVEELETLDRITSTAMQTSNMFEEARERVHQLNLAFEQGAISAAGMIGATQKLGEGLEKNVASKAAELFKDTATPLEQMQSKIDELNEMLDRGAIGWEIYARAVGAAVSAITDLNKSQNQLAGSAAFGSQAAYTTIAKAQMGGGATSGLDNLKDAIKKQVEIQKRQQKDLDEIARAARNGFLAVGKL
jgi:hypothetical protein